MIDAPLASVDDYVAYLNGAEIPALRVTQRGLDAARQRIDRISRHDLSTILLRDPLMTVKVLAYIQPMHGKSLRGDISTVGGAIMMLGIEPFFRRFAELPQVEERLADQPEVLLGVLKTIQRAQKAAEFARDWAVWRHDLNAEEVMIAALLHDIAELLLWTFAPRLMREIRRLQQANAQLRSVVAQKAVLGITTQELQLALCRVWQLPKLLRQLMDDTKAEHPRVRNVALAVDLARHLAQGGWQNAAIPDDIAAIAGLLNLNEAATRERLGVPPEAADASSTPAA
jgi:HD-like signal output (HDOD) protein